MRVEIPADKKCDASMLVSVARHNFFSDIGTQWYQV